MAEYAPVNLELQHVNDLIITGSRPEDQDNFKDLKDTLGVDSADRIAYPQPFCAIADGTLLPAMLKLKDLHGYSNVHVMDTVGAGEHKETSAYTRLRKMAHGAIVLALNDVAVYEYVIDSEREDEEEYRSLAVTCSDHRYQDAFEAVTENHMGQDIWRLVHPGPSIYITQGKLTLPIDTINPDRLGIFDHIDCGAAGGQAAHGGNITREAQAHFRKSRLAETVLAERFPFLYVHSHVVGPENELPPPHISQPEHQNENASDIRHKQA